MIVARIHPGIQNIPNIDSLSIESLQNIIIEVQKKEANIFNRNYTLKNNIEFAFKECCKADFIDCARYILQTYPQYCTQESLINSIASLCIGSSIALAKFLFKENGHLFDVHINDDMLFKGVYKIHIKNLGVNSKQLYEFLLFDLQMTISDELKQWITQEAPDVEIMINNYHLYNDMHESLPTTKKENSIKTKI